MKRFCVGGNKYFASAEEAAAFAEARFQKDGVVLSIEVNKPKPKKLSKKMLKQMQDARISRAILRLRIPMMSIPKLYREMEAAISEGKSDAELRAVVVAFPGVENVDG